MTDFLISLFSISAVMAAVILLLCIISNPLKKKVSASSRYFLWALIAVRLCIPVSLGIVPKLITIPVDAPKESAAETIVFEETAKPAETVLDAPETSASSVVGVEGPENVTVKPQISPDSAKPDSPVSSVGGAESPETDAKKPQIVPDAIQEAESKTEVMTTVSDTETAPKEEAFDFSLISYFIFAAWCAGAFISLSIEMAKYFKYRRYINDSLYSADEDMLSVYRELCGEMEIGNYPPLFLSKEAESPMLMGYFSPCLVYPESLTTDKSMRELIAHELTHYRRCDLWVKLMAVVARSLHWFNPAVYVAASRLENEMELSCDEKTLRGKGGEDRLAYGQSMLEVVKSCSEKSAPLTTNFNPQKQAVKERLMNIFDTTKKRKGIALISAILALCIVSGSVIGCSTNKNEAESGENTETTAPEKSNDPGPSKKRDPNEYFYIRTEGTKVENGVETYIVYKYDNEYRLDEEVHICGGVADKYFYYYSAEGALTDKTHYVNNGDRITISYSYDNGKIVKATQKGDVLERVVTKYIYDENGYLIKEEADFENSADKVTAYEYENGRLVSKSVSTQSGEAVLTKYTYDENGNLIKEEAPDLEITYKYKKISTKVKNTPLTKDQTNDLYGSYLMENQWAWTSGNNYDTGKGLFYLEDLDGDKKADLIITDADGGAASLYTEEDKILGGITFMFGGTSPLNYNVKNLRYKDDGSVLCLHNKNSWDVYVKNDTEEWGDYLHAYDLYEYEGKYYYMEVDEDKLLDRSGDRPYFGEDPVELTKEEYDTKLAELGLSDDNFKSIKVEDMYAITPENIEAQLGYKASDKKNAPEGAAFTEAEIDELGRKYGDTLLSDEVKKFLRGENDISRNLTFGDWYVTMEFMYTNTYPTARVTVDVVESSLDTIKPGAHIFELESGMIGVTVEDISIAPLAAWAYNDPMSFISTFYDMVGYEKLMRAEDVADEDMKDYARAVYDFMGEYIGPRKTKAEYLDRAEVMFGVRDVDAFESVFEKRSDGTYQKNNGHGGAHVYYKFIEADESSVTVQLYSDSGYMIKSDVIKYTFKNESDIHVALVSVEVLHESENEPLMWFN